MAPSHTKERKISEKILTLCSKSGLMEERVFGSTIRQVIWEIPVTHVLRMVEGFESYNEIFPIIVVLTRIE